MESATFYQQLNDFGASSACSVSNAVLALMEPTTSLVTHQILVVQSLHRAGNTVLSFNGNSKFTSNSANQNKMVVQSLHQTTEYLTSVELPILSTTTLSVTSSAILTTIVVVVQSMHQTILYFTSTVSIKLATSSTTQQMVVKVFAQFLT